MNPPADTLFRYVCQAIYPYTEFPIWTLDRASYASPAHATTNLSPEQAPARSRDSDGSFLPSDESRLLPRNRFLRHLVGSRTGAILRRFGLSIAPRFLWECLTSQTVSWVPAPATSNPSCRFPAMGLPARFARSFMRCSQLGVLSILMDYQPLLHTLPPLPPSPSCISPGSGLADC